MPGDSRNGRARTKKRTREVARRHHYTDAEIERGLVALALSSGNTRRASTLLASQGLRVPHTTLFDWQSSVFPERYAQVRESVLPRLKAELAEMHTDLARRQLFPAGEEAGVAWIGFHTLRHTCASLLFAAGRNVKQVQRWLGHHSPGFTLDTYVHLLDDGVGEGLDLGSELAESENKLRTDGAGFAAPTVLDNLASQARTTDSTGTEGTPALLS